MELQKHLFSLAENVTYINGAYMAPQLKSVAAVGADCLVKKNTPHTISETDFFSEKSILKKRFAQLIEAQDEETIAIIPSVSYGIATAVHNIPFSDKDEIVVLEEQFPSNYYAWKQLEAEKGVVVQTVTSPKISEGRAQQWNKWVLATITSKTKCVALPHCHWADGTLFDLEAISAKCREFGAYLIIDGTQSVGALPFSVEKIKPDALICGGYKWLMGPYSIGVAYFGERFHYGRPIENNWMNHVGSENFSNLVKYNHELKPKAARYDVGESSNFILTPMLSEAIRQLNDWTPIAVQEYCKTITKKPIETIRNAGFFIEDDAHRAHHLFGIYLPDAQDFEAVKQRISAKNIYVSYRGNAIRVSPNVYNSEVEMQQLADCF